MKLIPFLEGFIAVVWLSSECVSEQLSSYSFIYSFILICNLALTRLCTYVELYYGKSKKSTHKHININHSRYPNSYGTESNASLTSPMLTRYTRHQHQHATHATNASMPPMQARHPCYPCQHATHATHARMLPTQSHHHAAQPSSNSMPFLKLEIIISIKRNMLD